MAEDFCGKEDVRYDKKRSEALEHLHCGLRDHQEDIDTLLWQTILAYQNYPFYTTSGLPFCYTIKRKRNGEYSGELLISRKEGSKTLTKSSVLLAFHKILEEMAAGTQEHTPVIPEYSGPKAIGQIFGISYIYSLFWEMGLIRVPEKVERKLKNKKETSAATL